MKLKPIAASLMLAAFSISPAFANLIGTVSGAAGGQNSYNNTDNNTTSVVAQGSSTTNSRFFAGSSAVGDASGSYSAVSVVVGSGLATSQFTNNFVISNTNNYASSYSINSHISSGSIFLYNAEHQFASGNGYGEYALRVLTMDGSGTTNQLYYSAVKLAIDSTSSAATLTQTNGLGGATAITANSNYGFYAWGDQNLSFSLGTLNAGQSLTVQFDLVTTAYGDFGLTWPTCSGYGSSYGIYCYGGSYNDTMVNYGGSRSYGGVTNGATNGTGTFDLNFSSYGGFSKSQLGKARVTFGDPISVTSDPNFASISVVSSVPEPESYAMFGLGLITMLATRPWWRRRSA